jgi:hypothetical protein
VGSRVHARPAPRVLAAPLSQLGSPTSWRAEAGGIADLTGGTAVPFLARSGVSFRVGVALSDVLGHLVLKRLEGLVELLR